MKQDIIKASKLFLTNGTIIDPATGKEYNATIAIENGRIKDVGQFDIAADSGRILDCTGKVITQGFTDIHAHFREPGREDKETLETGSMAAMAGGFSTVCVMPNTDPVVDSPESIRFILDKSARLPVKIKPIGAITKGQKGTQLAEIGDMVDSGAVAVSDDGIPLMNGQMMRYALEYSRMLGIPVINHAEDVHIRNDGVMNESALSTRLGLPGNPNISESIMVYRDLSIAKFVHGRIHIPHVSTAQTVNLIRQFKDMGVRVTAEVTPHHLGLSEDKLTSFDTHAKVAPPLRGKDDREALIEGLRDGTIDCIATDHAPHTIEEKEADFVLAPCGMIGLESAFGMIHTVLAEHGFSLMEILSLLNKTPGSVMGWELETIQKGNSANLVILSPDHKWTFSEQHIYSRSKNSPFVGIEFTGKVEATIIEQNLLQID
ncbi:MAG: dihydroorotase [Candidatus Marinimicrobia bacterium]|nr:dihydroorotase [Candidatus Neomarinimicrobiota bacterium]